jgi:hypothetical protein
MSRGTPHTMKCPKCKRGMFGHPRRQLGVRPTGKLEPGLTRTHNRGHHGGGPSFYGHRGQVECLDCGHVWYSTHPDSGRREASRQEIQALG